jgi:hypothetical protein
MPKGTGRDLESIAAGDVQQHPPTNKSKTEEQKES